MEHFCGVEFEKTSAPGIWLIFEKTFWLFCEFVIFKFFFRASNYDDADVAPKLPKRPELSSEVPSKNMSHNQNHKRKKPTSSKGIYDLFDSVFSGCPKQCL